MGKHHSFKHPWAVVFGVSLCFFLVSYDTTAFNLALVAIQQDLHLSLSALDWVMTSMMIALGTCLVPGGRISDKYGHKTPILIGLVLFTLVTILGGFAHNAWQLISLRVLQGVFGALFWPGMQALMIYAVVESKRTISVGINQFSAAIGIATGPIISGFVLSHLSWRWVFWTTVPISCLALLILFIFIPKDAFTRNNEKIDFISAVFLSGCAFSTIHALDLLGRYGFGNSTTLAWCAIAVALFWFFIMRDDNISNPLINLEILKNRQFVTGVIMRIVSATCYFTFLFLTGFALQHIALLPPQKAGLFFLPLTFGLMTFSLTTSILAKFFDIKKLMFTGFVIFGLSCFVYGTVVQFSMSYWAIATPLAMMGIGFGMFGTTNTIFTIGSLPKTLSGSGAGVMTMCLMVFGSIGIVLASIFIRTIGSTVAIKNLLLQNIPLNPEQTSIIELAVVGRMSINDALVHFGTNGKEVYLAIRKGFFDAMSWDLFMIGSIALVIFLIFLPLKFRKTKKSL